MSLIGPYVNARNGGLYVGGTRVSLASVVHAYRQGLTPEGILLDYPALGSIDAVRGAIAVMLENSSETEAYLAGQERLWRNFEAANPLPGELRERFLRGRDEFRRLSA